MKERKKMRKFNVFVGFLVLAAIGLWAGYFIVNKQNNTASISRQVSQILEKNIKPVSDCQPNFNNQNQDSDSDGLKDWEELTWKTDPCIPDTDKDGYLDGEETSAGYNPLLASPGDKLPEEKTASDSLHSLRSLPKNLTQELAKDLTQKTIQGQITPMEDENDFASLDANYPVISAAIQKAVDQSSEEFVLPDIADEEIIVSDNDSYEAVKSYSQNVAQLIKEKVNEIKVVSDEQYESEAQLFYEAISNNDYTEINKYIRFYNELYQELKRVPTPNNFKDLHKEQLGFFWIMSNIHKAISQTAIDPIKANLALEQYRVVNDLNNQFIQKLSNQLRLSELTKDKESENE